MLALARCALALVFALVLCMRVQAAEPIKIGFSVSLTGGLASSGKAHLLSKQIWAEASSSR